MVMKPNNVKFSDFWTHDKQKKNMHFNFSWTLNYGEKVLPGYRHFFQIFQL